MVKTAYLMFSALLISLAVVSAHAVSALSVVLQSGTAVVGANDSIIVTAGGGSVLKLMIDGDVVASGPSPLVFNLASLNSSQIKPGAYIITAEDTSTGSTQNAKLMLVSGNSSADYAVLTEGIVNASPNDSAPADLQQTTRPNVATPAFAVVITAIAAAIVTTSGSRYIRRRTRAS